VGVKIDSLTAEYTALTNRADSGVTRLQAYYDNGANGMRAEIIPNNNEMDQKWAVMQSTVDILNRQLYDMKNVGSSTSGHG
jgi:hypothetical protein